MNVNRVQVVLFLTMVLFLTGCGLFRWSGHYEHDDTFPQLHRDWSKNPYFPAGSEKEDRIKLKFPQTREEHLESNRRFLAKARWYRNQANDHREIISSYDAIDPTMKAHCEETSERFESLAKDMERFAKWHQNQAEQTNK